MKKKLTFILTLLLGGIVMVTLSACSKYNNREWIENKVSEVSRVYPTENLFDLFKEFPEGFSILQTSHKTINNERLRITVFMVGDVNSKTIKGTIKAIKVHTKPYKEEVKKSTEIEYRDGKFAFSDENTAKELWDYNGFLLQKLTLNKKELSKLDLKEKNYNSVTNTFEIYYELDNSVINNYLSTKGEQIMSISGAMSNNNEKGYRLNVVISSQMNKADGIGEIISTWEDEKKGR